MDTKLTVALTSQLDFIRKILDFSSKLTSEQEKEVLEIIKQYSDYDFAAEIVKKIQQKYRSNWF